MADDIDDIATTLREIAALVERVSDSHQADIFLYSGGIQRGADARLFKLIKKNRSKPNVLLIMTTTGGDPDAAYRIARHLQQQYGGEGKFKLFVETICKSAGTLIALGSDAIIMCDSAELGPVDMQMWSREEVGELSSGLTPTQALTTLRTEALKHFEESFKKLRSWPMRFSTKIAAEISTKMSVGLMEPIYAQIDPMRLGENQRTMLIAAEYGQRLIRANAKKHAVAKIVSGYPSHGFIIDRTEACELFNEVRGPTEDELSLLAALAEFIKDGQDNDDNDRPPVIRYISSRRYIETADKMMGVAEKANGKDSGTNRAGTEAIRADGQGTSGNGGSQSAVAS